MKLVRDKTDEASEGKFCPRCGKPLKYSYYQYSAIGRFICENDGFGTIHPDIEVTVIDYKNETFTVGKTRSIIKLYQQYLRNL